MHQVGFENWVMRPLLTLECSNEVIRSFVRIWMNFVIFVCVDSWLIKECHCLFVGLCQRRVKV